MGFQKTTLNLFFHHFRTDIAKGNREDLLHSNVTDAQKTPLCLLYSLDNEAIDIWQTHLTKSVQRRRMAAWDWIWERWGFSMLVSTTTTEKRKKPKQTKTKPKAVQWEWFWFKKHTQLISNFNCVTSNPSAWHWPFTGDLLQNTMACYL